MKKALFLLLSLCTLCASAQVQKGYVKTKGRLGENGQVITGQRLGGTAITVQGRMAVVSQDNGDFSLTLAEKTYMISNVQKQGYTLVDMDMLSRQYSHSAENPFIIVMETQSNLNSDRLMAERKIRRTLQRELQKQEDLIAQLQAENKITEEKYYQLMEELYAQEESNQKLVKEMAERYAKVDYDQLDEFNRKVNELILNGELSRADSLLNSRGSIEQRITTLHKQEKANQAVAEEISQMQSNLDKSQALTAKEKEYIAQDCYSKFEIFKMKHENDSAAYYIGLRAELDTLNVDWLLEAGEFVATYCAQYDKAMHYNQRALDAALAQHGENHPDVATTYSNMGSVYAEQGIFDKTLELFNKSLDIRLSTVGEGHPETAMSYNNLGFVYVTAQGAFDKALECFHKALDIQNAIEENTPLLDRSTPYYGIGITYHYQRDYAKAQEYYNKALEIQKETMEENHPDIASAYNNLAAIYDAQGEGAKALEYYDKAMEIWRTAFGENHPSIANVNNGIGIVYTNQGNFAKGLEYLQKALDIKIRTVGSKHPEVGTTYYNMAVAYEYQGDVAQALEYYNKALDIRKATLDENHPQVANAYNGIALLYFSHDYERLLREMQSITAFVVYVEPEDNPSVQTGGMSGEYYLLEFGDWKQDGNYSLLKRTDELEGKQKAVVMREGTIFQYDLENSQKVFWGVKYVGEAEKARINAAYKEWKESQKK